MSCCLLLNKVATVSFLFFYCIFCFAREQRAAAEIEEETEKMLAKRLDHIRAATRSQNLGLFRLTMTQSLQQFYSTTRKQQSNPKQQSPSQSQQEGQQPLGQQQQPQSQPPLGQQQQKQQEQSQSQSQSQAQSPSQEDQQQQQQLQQTSSQSAQDLSSSGENLSEEQQQLKGAKSATDTDWLTQELAVLKEEHSDLLNKYKRALADGENMRKRLIKQIEEAKIFGIQSFCKDLIDVADVLGHATQAVPKDKLKGNVDLRNLYEGLNLTRASLLQVFKRHGLETLDPINEKFDPNLHEALFQTEDDTVEADTVIQVTKLGYKLHKRCIRPALVGVSKR